MDPSNVEPQPLNSPPPKTNGWLRGVFLGADGLRAGWRFVLYLLIAALIEIVLVTVTHFAGHRYLKGTPRIWFLLLSELQLMLAALGAALVMSLIEKRPFGIYGLPATGAFGKAFWLGALWGIAAITLLLVVIRAAGDFYFGAIVLHGTRLAKFALFWGLFFLVVGFFEEFLMRGYTLFTLTQGMGFWPAALSLSAIFGAIHLSNQGEGWIGALSVGLIGLFFCLTLRRTGTLWFAVGMHAAWDWGESFLYSVPDSGTVVPGHLMKSSFQGSSWLTGGTVGPEGSVLVFAVVALLWILFDRLYPDVKYGVEQPPPLTAPLPEAPPLP